MTTRSRRTRSRTACSKHASCSTIDVDFDIPGAVSPSFTDLQVEDEFASGGAVRPGKRLALQLLGASGRRTTSGEGGQFGSVSPRFESEHCYPAAGIARRPERRDEGQSAWAATMSTMARPMRSDAVAAGD